MEHIGLFVVYLLIWFLCVFSFIKDRNNFLALIGMILLTIFLPSMIQILDIL